MLTAVQEERSSVAVGAGELQFRPTGCTSSSANHGFWGEGCLVKLYTRRAQNFFTLFFCFTSRREQPAVS